MQNAQSLAASLESPITRAAGYALLAHAFAYPTEERVLAMREAAAAGASLLERTPLAPLLAPAGQASSALLLPRHTAIFSLTSSPDCPAHETGYLDTDMLLQAQRMARIAGLYRLFGIDSPARGFRPDHVSVELEFLSFLARKEAYAAEHLGAPRVAQARKAQRLFLGEHLGCWAGALAAAIARSGTATAFYLRLALAFEGWVAADCDRLGVAPAQLAGRPSVLAAGPHSHGPEFAGDAQLIVIADIKEVGQR